MNDILYADLTALLETAMRVEREGLEAGFDMRSWHCGTSACLVGWHLVFKHGLHYTSFSLGMPPQGDWFNNDAVTFTRKVCEGLRRRFRMSAQSQPPRQPVLRKLLMLLAGTDNGFGEAALTRQIKRLYYFLNRLERLREYEEYQAMTRRERRQHDIRRHSRVLEAA